MPNAQRHRGKHPDDEKLFMKSEWPSLENAVNDYIYLLDRGYSASASLKVVGDRYALKKRQRQAVDRIACTLAQRDNRHSTSVSVDSLPRRIVIDGYNILITVECALSGGILFACRDGAYRDLASVHGSYKTVEETEPALHLIGTALEALGVNHATWYFDKPVSNSGRLAQLICETGRISGWDWDAMAVFNPDKELVASGGLALSSDGWVLDNCVSWFNLVGHLLESGELTASVISI